LQWWSEFRNTFAEEKEYQTIIWNNKEIKTPLEQDKQNQLSSVGWSPTLYTLTAKARECTIINPISLFYSRK